MVALYKGRNFSIKAGGVRRQVYTKEFQDFADNRVIKLFEGEDNDQLLQQKLDCLAKW